MAFSSQLMGMAKGLSGGTWHLHASLYSVTICRHAVSRDLIKWAHLPVSIWNDRLYDERAIFTGSATVVNGKPYLVYPGLCVKGRQPDCNSGTILALAVPANDSDPFYTQWKKLDALNPIVNNTGRDPTTAWLTDAGEWRMVTYDKQLHVSTDFLHWTNPGPSALPAGTVEEQQRKRLTLHLCLTCMTSIIMYLWLT